MSVSFRSYTKWSLVVVTAVLAVGLILALCIATGTAGATSPSAAPGKVVLKIGWTGEPDNLNPFIGWQNATYEIWAMNYDFLFGFGLNNEPIPDLATELPTKANGDISSDGKVWTIHLRTGVKWQDGTPLTADDVAWTYNYVVKNHMANMAIGTVGIVGARVIDAQTVEITCSRPKADMEKIFLPILPKHVWQDVSPEEAQTSYANKPPIIGSGPFQVVDFKKGTSVRLERNPSYWGKRPAVDEIWFLLYQNADAMVADLKLGTIDAAWGVPVAQFKALGSSNVIETVPYLFFNWTYLNFNCYTGESLGNPVLRDWRFRNALNYAVDRQKICAISYGGMATPGSTILTPGMWTNPDYHWEPPAGEAYGFDLAKANQLLDEAGYKRDQAGLRENDGKPISLRLWATTETSEEQRAAKLVAGWLRELGIKVELSVLDPGALQSHVWNFRGSTYEPDYDMYIWDWAGYSDPGQTLSSMTTEQIGNTNESCWSNAAYDKLNVQQSAALDPQERQAIIWKMQQIMYEQTPWVVLAYPQYLEAYRTDRWTGWTRLMDGTGPAFNTAGNLDSYLNLAPRTASASKSNSTGWIAAGVVVLVIVVAGLVLLRRRRDRAEEI